MTQIQTLKFASLDKIPNLHHAISTRAGGVSIGEYSSLNLGFHVGDEPENVRENRRILATHLGFDSSSLVAAQQTHSANIETVELQMRGCGAGDWDSALPQTDGLIIAEKNLPAMILVADCAPLILVDERRKIFALVHAGWRGAVARIASRTIEEMKNLGSRAEDIQAGIGPHLCAGCFEIGEEVAQAVKKIAPQSVIHQEPKPHLALGKLLRADLQNAGVLTQNIETMKRCPRCENQLFFSHRGQNGVAGRFGLVAFWE